MVYFYERLDGWPTRIIGIVILVGIAVFGFYTYRNIESEKLLFLTQLEESNDRNLILIQMVRDRDSVINSFQGQIHNISSTVGTLEKLSQTDEELLEKYSKIYFLNENYVPANLADIEGKYLLPDSKNFMIYAKVWPYLRDMMEEANRGGHKLLVASAYRSFDAQAILKNGYTFIYGKGANRFSADQGYSEHQLGTTVDFTTAKLGINFSSFANDSAYKWLQENAYKYGFILSYPPNNTYYKFEPWHWRFVGIGLATFLHEEGKYFYDLDQREIDQYLIKLFD